MALSQQPAKSVRGWELDKARHVTGAAGPVKVEAVSPVCSRKLHVSYVDLHGFEGVELLQTSSTTFRTVPAASAT